MPQPTPTFLPATGVPVLTDGVVTLRAPSQADVDGLVAMGTDPETVRTSFLPEPYERRHAELWVHEGAPSGRRDPTAFRWAVTTEHDGVARFAGAVEVDAGPPPRVRYGLAPWARGRGLMSRALRLAARWGFTQARLPVLHWSATAGDLASWRVAHACGFTFDGERPMAADQRGVLRDCWYASLRPDDEQSPRTTWWPVPELRGSRVRLRAHTDADVPRIVEACSDPRTQYWLTVPDPYTEDSARRFLRDCRLGASLGRRVTWAVTGPDDDRLLANVGIFRLAEPLNPTGAEIGYWAHPDARGRSVVGEAVELAVAHAFTPVAEGGLGRHRVQLGAAWSNSASRHVAERAGFTLVGRHRQDGTVGRGDERTLDDGAWYDLLATDRG
jgi:[ribosomal protein S5]-alanine N-acetyltransferase